MIILIFSYLFKLIILQVLFFKFTSCTTDLLCHTNTPDFWVIFSISDQLSNFCSESILGTTKGY